MREFRVYRDNIWLDVDKIGNMLPNDIYIVRTSLPGKAYRIRGMMFDCGREGFREHTETFFDLGEAEEYVQKWVNEKERMMIQSRLCSPELKLEPMCFTLKEKSYDEDDNEAGAP